MAYDEIKCFKTLCRILISLEEFSKESWNNLKDNPREEYEIAIENIKVFNDIRYPLESKRLMEQAHSKTGSPYVFLNRPWFYLPPLYGDDRHFIPILYLDFDVRNEPHIISYRLSMLSVYNPDMKWDPKGFGFRFEIGRDNSSHAYCHVQITTDTMGWGKPLHPSLSWIPEQTPCFPLPAICPISLFLSLIVGLYGKHLATKIISDVDIAKEYLEPLKNIIQI